MNYQERAALISGVLESTPTVSVEALAKLLNVTVVTVRKDLTRMEKAGLLVRTFGGAARTATGLPQNPNTQMLRRIANRAAEEVSDGDCIILNAGSTTLLLAKCLLLHKNLKLITNSIPLGRELINKKDCQLILLGGRLSGDAVFTHGKDAIRQMAQYKADKLFLSVNGVSLTSGLTTRHAMVADLFMQMIERANEVIVLADDSKFGFESFCHVCDLTAVDKIIMNETENNREALLEIEQSGIIVCRC